MYTPENDKDQRQMLECIGVSDKTELFKNIPDNLKFKEISVSGAMTELELLRTFTKLSQKNKNLDNLICFKGAGIYDHFIPAIVDEVAGRSEFWTAYTPYQAEASQGTLQAIFEYQSLICALTNMDISNACLYDGATAVAEAVLLAIRATGKTKVLISKALNPEYLNVTKTYLKNLPAEIIEIPVDENGQTSKTELETMLNKTDDICCFIAQSPNYYGIVEDMAGLKSDKCLFVAVVNPISLGVLSAPGDYAADIAVGEGQPLGNAPSMGGATFGFMAVKRGLERNMPGRIVGQTVDAEGKRGFVLTLQTREQHIRRQKATSNICTNSALNALRGGIYLSYFNDASFKHLAQVNVSKARYLAGEISKVEGFKLKYSGSPFFNEFAAETPKPVSKINKILLKHGILGGVEINKNTALFCVTEKI
ncbi:MAG: aminomethyl-transferring glycine dehydrogenase subunit GcvPA, partial [Elusimicrobia bacterium]|nr:aminomethyl-transferring glycine dehydrogenase subunit GcvPA [Elusimicrobiota bacterium]